MALLLVETPNEQAHAALLALLAELNVCLVREVEEVDTPPKNIVKRKWAGSISAETARMMQEEVRKMREEEWDRDF